MTTHIYASGEKLPDGLLDHNFFHSPQFFALCRQTPRFRPYMVIVTDEEQRIVAQLLAIVRYRSSLFPPYLYRQCQILGEGVYAADDLPRNELFGLMLQTITSRLGRWMLYIEVSHLSQKMFGYREFRQSGYFPVRWMSIHNSLHSKAPEERISQRMKKRIDSAYARGVVTDEVGSDDDFEQFMRLLRHHNWLKPKRYIPDSKFFSGLMQTGNGQLYLTRWRERIIGCSAVVVSQEQAYLWYAAYRRKTFRSLRPDVLTVWHAIKDAHRQGRQHIFFMDVGLPFRKNAFRDFILRFGGKPTSTYRWFRCSIRWVNALLSWIYRD